MKYILLLGRILFSLLFILAGFDHFSLKTILWASSQGVPFSYFFVPFSGLIACLGGFLILFGLRAKLGAWLLIIFLVPVTFMMHKFWGLDDATASLQKVMFMKNLSLLGAAFIISYMGSGPLSIDKKGK